MSHNIPTTTTTNRSITASTTTASSPSFTDAEHIQHYPLLRTNSEQPANNESVTSTPSSSRRTSTSDGNETPRIGL